MWTTWLSAESAKCQRDVIPGFVCEVGFFTIEPTTLSICLTRRIPVFYWWVSCRAFATTLPALDEFQLPMVDVRKSIYFWRPR